MNVVVLKDDILKSRTKLDPNILYVYIIFILGQLSLAIKVQKERPIFGLLLNHFDGQILNDFWFKILDGLNVQIIVVHTAAHIKTQCLFYVFVGSK